MESVAKRSMLGRLFGWLRLFFWILPAACMVFGNLPMVLPMDRVKTEIRVAGYPRCYSVFQRDLTTERSYHWFSTVAFSADLLVFVALVALIAWNWKRWLNTSQFWRWSILEILAITLLVGLSLTWYRERAPFRGSTHVKSAGVDTTYKDCSWLPKKYKKWSVLRAIGCVSLPFASKINVMEDQQFKTRKLELWTNSLVLMQAQDSDFEFLPSSSLLREVTIEDSEVGERGAAWLASLPNLEKLQFKANNLSSYPADALERLESLLTLDLTETQISLDNLEHIVRIPSLRKLLINTDQLGPKLWTGIEGHQALQRLSVSYPFKRKGKPSRINETFSISLKSLPNLRFVDHPGCEVDTTLIDLPNLESFSVDEKKGPSKFGKTDIQNCPKLKVDAMVEIGTENVPRIRNVKSMKIEIKSDNAQNVNAFLSSLTEKENCNHLSVTSASPMILDKLPIGVETLFFEGVGIDFDRIRPDLLSELADCKIVGIQPAQLDKFLSSAKGLKKIWLSTHDGQLTFAQDNLEEVSIAFEVSDASQCRIEVLNCPKLEKIHIVTGVGPISFGLHHAPRLGAITSYLSGLKRTFHVLKGSVSLRELDIGEDFRIDPNDDLSFKEDGGYLKTLRLEHSSPDAVLQLLTRSKLTWIDTFKLEDIALPEFPTGFEALRVAEVQCRNCEVDPSNFARLFSRKGKLKEGHFRKCVFRPPVASTELSSPTSKLGYVKLHFEKCKFDVESARWIGDHFIAQELLFTDCEGDYREVLRSLDETTSTRMLTIQRLDEGMIETLSGIDVPITIRVTKKKPGPEIRKKLSQHFWSN